MQLPSLQSVHVLVVGDVMLDRYWRGPARRVSPEAPVPVIDVPNLLCMQISDTAVVLYKNEHNNNQNNNDNNKWK